MPTITPSSFHRTAACSVPLLPTVTPYSSDDLNCVSWLLNVTVVVPPGPDVVPSALDAVPPESPPPAAATATPTAATPPRPRRTDLVAPPFFLGSGRAGPAARDSARACSNSSITFGGKRSALTARS